MAFVEKELLQRLYSDEGMSMHEVAEAIGVSVGTVYNYIKAYDIPSRPKMTQKTRMKISASNKGKLLGRKRAPFSDEHKRKISLAKKGRFKKESMYGGHKKLRQDGYVIVYCPLHPNATADGYVMEHILVMESQIGRLLAADEVVHHKNKVRNDNRIENLSLMTFKEHASLHMKERWNEKKRRLNNG